MMYALFIPPLGLFIALAAVPFICALRILRGAPSPLPAGWRLSTAISLAALLGGVFFAVLFLHPPLQIALAHLNHLPSGAALSAPAAWLSAVGRLLALSGELSWGVGLLSAPLLMGLGVMQGRRWPFKILLWQLNALLWPLVGGVILAVVPLSRVGGHRLALTALLAASPFVVYAVTARVARWAGRWLWPEGAAVRERARVEIVRRGPLRAYPASLTGLERTPGGGGCPRR